MNRAAIDSSVVPLEPFSFSARSVPSLDELYQKMCVPDQRIVIRGVDWAFYEHLVDSIPEGCHIHVDYDGKDLELMSPISPFHDEAKKLLGQFVEAVAQELGIPYKGLGQTTWKRFEVARGLESDECYYFKPEKLAASDAAKARRSKDVADYPNPDLSIEVDISPSRIDRPGIYAALVVAEVWRFDHEQGRIVIERDTACVACPWHGSTFAIADGTVVHGPATARQPAFETRVTADGRVELRARP